MDKVGENARRAAVLRGDRGLPTGSHGAPNGGYGAGFAGRWVSCWHAQPGHGPWAVRTTSWLTRQSPGRSPPRKLGYQVLVHVLLAHRRRSCSLASPHAVVLSGAKARRCRRTGQPAQMAFARVT